MSKAPLDYRRPGGKNLDSMKLARANTLAAWSFICLWVPAAGFVLRIGPMFLCGGVLAPLVGMAAAFMGMMTDRRATVFCSVALGMNALVLSYFGWFIFVRGLC